MNALEDLMLRLLVVVAFISITLGVIENGWEKVRKFLFFQK